MRNVVVLPAPFGPSNPKISPRVTLNDVSSTAVKSPNFLTRFSTTITGLLSSPFVFRTSTFSPKSFCGLSAAIRRDIKASSSLGGSGLRDGTPSSFAASFRSASFDNSTRTPSPDGVESRTRDAWEAASSIWRAVLPSD